MSFQYLVIDVEALLDQSQVGLAGAALLKKRMLELDEKAKGLRKQAAAAKGEVAVLLKEEAAELTKNAASTLEDARFTLRTAVLNRAENALREISVDREISLVLERKMVVLFDEKNDVTEEVMKRIDAAGPLEI